jgi:predicted enzyme related to lactoylglutathione lyase
MIPKPHEASIVLYVSDIARSERFYRDTLGLEVERREGAEPFWMSAKLAFGLEFIFFQMPAKMGTTPAIVFSVNQGGIDDIVANLAAKGVTIVTPVSEAPGGWSADFVDPDGFGLGLWQPGDKPRSLKKK